MIAGEWDYEHLDFHRGIYYGTGRKGIYSVELRKGQSKVWCFAKTYDKKLCSVQSLSCRTLCDSLDCSTPGFPVLHHLPELAQTHVHWVSDTIQPSSSLLFSSPPSFNFPSIRVYSNESALHIRWPKYWSFNFSISPSNEYSGLISFRINWFDLLAVQGTLKSLLQYHSSKASILWHSSFFMVQFSYPYMTTGKKHSFDYIDFYWQSNVSAF